MLKEIGPKFFYYYYLSYIYFVIFHTRTKCRKIFSGKITYVKIFYDRNHFTSKEIGPKFFYYYYLSYFFNNI
jgi:hypothetical protein